MLTLLKSVVLKKTVNNETYIFGAKCIAMKQVIYVSRGFRNKLRKLGIPISEPITAMRTISQWYTIPPDQS